MINNDSRNLGVSVQTDVSRRDALTRLLGAGAVGVGALALSGCASGVVVDCVSTIPALRATQNPEDILCADVLGYHERGDGGGGRFWFDSGATETDNGGTIIKPNAIQPDEQGRWRRLIDENEGVSVKWFGARGDGLTDDQPAIQAAIDAVATAGGGIVCFPAGIFKVNDTLKFGSGVIFQGVGASSTTIKGDLKSAIFQSKDPLTRYYFVHFRDLKIDNTSKDNVNGIGIDFTNISVGGIRNVHIRNVEIGIHLSDQAYYNDLFSPLIFDAISGINMVGGANENRVYGGKIDNVETGITLNSVSNPQIYGTSIENVTTGIEIGPISVSSPKIFGCRFENITSFGISIAPTTLAAIIIGPYFQNVATTIQDDATNTNIVANNNWKISGGTNLRKHLSVQQMIDFPPIAAHSTHDELVIINGVLATDSVFVAPHPLIDAGLMVMGIPTNGGVRIRMANITGAAIDPQGLTFTIDVWQH